MIRRNFNKPSPLIYSALICANPYEPVLVNAEDKHKIRKHFVAIHIFLDCFRQPLRDGNPLRNRLYQCVPFNVYPFFLCRCKFLNCIRSIPQKRVASMLFLLLAAPVTLAAVAESKGGYQFVILRHAHPPSSPFLSAYTASFDPGRASPGSPRHTLRICPCRHVPARSPVGLLSGACTRPGSIRIGHNVPAFWFRVYPTCSS